MCDIQAIILAAGLGTRMGENFKKIPKCLIMINGETLLERHIRILNNNGIKNIVVIIGTKGKCWTAESKAAIKSIHQEILKNDDNLNTNNTYSLTLGLKDIKEGPILVIDGDTFYSEYVIKAVLEREEETFLLTQRAKSKDQQGNRVLINGSQIKDIGRVIEVQFPWLIFTGLLKIGKKEYNIFKKLLGREFYRKKELSYPLMEIVSQVTVHNIETIDGCININTTMDIEKAEDWIKENHPKGRNADNNVRLVSPGVRE